MEITYVEGTVTGPTGEQADLRFLVDSGAMYTLIPNDIWHALGLSLLRTQRFSLADGTVIERGISECRIRIPYGEGTTTVILGEPADEALLGVVTLEQFGLMINPFTRSIEPMRLMLA